MFPSTDPRSYYLAPTVACSRWKESRRPVELTVAIAHQQHSMVDEPRTAEGAEWVSDPMAVELRRKQGAGCQLKGDMRGGIDKRWDRGGEARASPACQRR